MILACLLSKAHGLAPDLTSVTNESSCSESSAWRKDMPVQSVQKLGENFSNDVCSKPEWPEDYRYVDGNLWCGHMVWQFCMTDIIPAVKQGSMLA